MCTKHTVPCESSLACYDRLTYASGEERKGGTPRAYVGML